MLTSYEGFEVSLIGNGRGAVSVHVQATAGEGAPGKLTYGFEIDQSFLPAIAADISRLFLSGPEAEQIGPTPADHHALVQERDGAAAGAGEEEGQQPVQETGHPAQDHAQAEASGRLADARHRSRRRKPDDR